MIKKTTTYTDYNGVERTEDFYFHFNKVELTELQMSVDGGYIEHLKRILNSKDERAIMTTLKDFVLKAYGEKTGDGKGFTKSPKLSDAFYNSAAYPVIFEEITANADAITEFITGVFPVKVTAPAAITSAV
jgi:hypothetical protein